MEKQSKLDQILAIFKNSAIFLLIAITNILVMTSILFICKVSITPYHLPVIYILSIMIFLMWKRKTWKKSVIAIAVATIVFSAATFWIGNIYDATADGNTYHKLAVGAMKNGWNPVYEDVQDFGIDKGNPFNVLKDNVNVKWVDHYAKGTETFGAVIYSFTGNIESGKVYNVLWIYIGFFVLFGILKQMNLNTWKSLLISGVMAFNPIILVQVTNYYLDGVLTISLFMIILCCLLQQKKLSKEEHVENYLLLASAIIWCINSKFTGLGFAGVFCFVFYLYHHLRTWLKEKDLFYKNIIWDSSFYAIVVITSVVIVGSSSYTRNFINHGHPLYPLYGKGHVQNMVMMEIPSSLQDKNSLTIFLTSIFSKGENVSPSYSNENIQPKLKIPLTTSKEEIDNYSIPDIRMAGFGPLFSGVFILGMIGTIIIIIEYIKTKNWNELIPYIITLLTITALALLLDGSYWARYIPYVYLIPIFVLIHFFQKDIKIHKLLNGFALMICLILVVNSSLIMYRQRQSVMITNEYIATRMDKFKEYANTKKGVDIKLAHSGIQGVQYNLDDFGIKNYKLTKKDLKNDCYMFQY